MEIIRTVSQLTEFAEKAHKDGKKIGLVPTMGALHAGHLSLVKRAVDENEVTIASVFVNPTQFNNPNDLATYPRKEEDDFNMLQNAGITAVFAPTVQEIYPDGPKHDKQFDLGNAAEVMEGKFRPGHFQGVAQIVSKLFEYSQADKAYFGEKDFQQIAVIRNMVKSEGIDIQIVNCPILREDDGLALSSRNALLTPQQRETAPQIHRILSQSLDYARQHTPSETAQFVVSKINAVEGLETEYYEIVDPDTLMPLSAWNHHKPAVGCVTVYCGKVRLIDNIRYNII